MWKLKQVVSRQSWSSLRIWSVCVRFTIKSSGHASWSGPAFSPLLFPFWSRNMVHSSIDPNGIKSCLTSSSNCCLLSIPTKSLRSSGKQNKIEDNRCAYYTGASLVNEYLIINYIQERVNNKSFNPLEMGNVNDKSYWVIWFILYYH